MMKKTNEKNELVLLKAKIVYLEEQLDRIHFFLKDAIKMRMNMDSTNPMTEVDRFLP